MCIRDVSQATSAMMQIRQDNDLLNRIVANDIYLWNQVSQLARKEHGSMGRECQHSLEEIVQKATQNLNLAPSPSDEKMDK